MYTTLSSLFLLKYLFSVRLIGFPSLSAIIFSLKGYPRSPPLWFFAFSGSFSEAHCYFPFVCHTLHTGCSVLSVMFFPLFALADIQRCVIWVVALKVALSIQAKKTKHTQNNCYISKCSSKLGLSLWDSMGSPWKGFVEFTLPASTPTAYVSADLSSTSPVGLSLSPYGRSVSCTFVALFPCPHSIAHPFTHLALHLFFVNGLAFFILFWVPENSLYSEFCRVREIFTRSYSEEIWQFNKKKKQSPEFNIFLWLLIW